MNLSASYWRRYHDLGWSVIPVRENSKKPLVAWIKYQQERPDLQQITQWPKLWPNAGIAVVTGAISGVFVLDVDEIPTGACSAKEAQKRQLSRDLIESLPPTATARTSHGRHFYFRMPLDAKGAPRHVPTKVRFLPGLDVRGDGGYAILPPTVHPDKTIYIWDYIPEDGIADAPPELLAAILENKSEILESLQYADGSSSWRTALAGCAEGEGRNNFAAKVIGKLLESTPEDLWALQWEALKSWNRDSNKPPLDEHELRTTFESICKAERKRRGSGEMVVQSVADLEEKELPPPIFAVKNLIYGLTLLVAKPKIGKSTLALQTAISVVAGLPLFTGKLDIGEDEPITWDTRKGPVIYLDLEDSETRLRDRVRRMTGGALPKDLFYTLRAQPMAEGGLKKLQLEIERLHPSLVIIDMFQTFAGIDQRAGRNAYQEEYRTMRLLWELANASQVPILALQHARKDLIARGASQDPFDSGSGTLGAPGAADTVLVMRSEKAISLNGSRPAKHAKLFVRGRDVSEYELNLVGDAKTKKWRIGS